MKNKLILAMFCSCLSLSAQAQQLFANNDENIATDKANENILPTLPEDGTVPPSAIPTEMTPEQKIMLQQDLRKNIQSIAVNTSPKDRKMMLEAIETLERMRIRQENLGRPENERIEFEKPNVNVNDRKDFQKYMQKIFISDVDDRLKKLSQPKEVEQTTETFDAVTVEENNETQQ